MKNQSENDFKTKFRLLNSQENSEEIIWSCSDSSDYENANQNENLGKVNQALNRKRKRGKTRKKTLKNISNLNITFIDAAIEQKHEKKVVRSPILQKVSLSPILTDCEQNFAPINNKQLISSPILSCNSRRSSFNQSRTTKSPILLLNHTSPKISPNVRKKLFENNSVDNKSKSKENGRSKSPVLNCSQIIKKSRLDYSFLQENAVKSIKPSNTNNKHDVNVLNKLNGNFEKTDLSKQIQVKNESRMNASQGNFNDSLNTATPSIALFEKVKSYFDSHFSSETPSQQSISEYDTSPKNSSKTSEEIEIINSQTAKKCVPKVIKLENKSSSDSLRSYDFQMEKSKKIRYKKDGLAHRLNVLLRKQKANLCLWQHERFLAANSNFVLPSDDFTAFLIQKVTFKYGCYLLEVRDGEENKYFVLINHLNMNNDSLEQCKVFKLYRPFKILDFNSKYQLIVNVTKFECTILKTNR